MFDGKTHYKWHFLLAMLNYRRVPLVMRTEMPQEKSQMACCCAPRSQEILHSKPYCTNKHMQHAQNMNCLVDGGNSPSVRELSPPEGSICSQKQCLSKHAHLLRDSKWPGSKWKLELSVPFQFHTCTISVKQVQIKSNQNSRVLPRLEMPGKLDRLCMPSSSASQQWCSHSTVRGEKTIWVLEHLATYPLVNQPDYGKSSFFGGKTHYKWAMFNN